ncbi:site-specific DNA-methyltransferase (adenine-specific) [Weissella beninensis]|uniref:Methyltransferase n=1 Tax=Periweissella beninensis TaxID=504936 RepID=A0ABT0VES8_9LACO|nr:site-specific DNA-methyltransferase [Periweissella beninensis]MBM7545037.1 site-specific DNA-methyltransferase (adenine-specific) [Periweissella beninensis]MCM2436367.1 site-specific DNA-methyltransferase [Periweissella beninensis]
MDQIKLIVGDSITNMKAFESNSVDLIIADPPYNLAKDYKATNDNMEFEEFMTFSRNWLTEATRILKPGGTIYVFMGMRLISYTHVIMEQELGLEFHNWITWHYTQGLGKKKGFSSRHDDILMFTKSGKNPTFNLDDIRIPQKYYRSINNMRGANPGNVWEFSHVHYSQSNRKAHPTQKPEGVIERMILASSNKNDIVLDPFSGSGTTVRVAQQSGRKAIGIDIEPSFIEETKKRLAEPFNGFDSIDERMLRVPNDLNDEEIRREYFKNHIEWFLKNHEGSLITYFTDFKNKYDSKMSKEEILEFENTVKKYNVKLKKSRVKKNIDPDLELNTTISLF